jgi:hypothetical protein
MLALMDIKQAMKETKQAEKHEEKHLDKKEVVAKVESHP